MPEENHGDVAPHLLSVENLVVDCVTNGHSVRAVDNLSFTIGHREVFALTGESGSGKSVTALSIARLLPTPPVRYIQGAIKLNGRDVFKMSEEELREIRGGFVGFVFQEPNAVLNPVFTIGDHVMEALKVHRPQMATNTEVARLLRLVGIPAPEVRLRDFPDEFSGGMRQRALIATALAAQPKLLVADEPTTALDVTIQAQILELLKDVKDRLGMSIFLITHNLGVVSELADRVAVIYAGQIVELASAADLFHRPLHPYTRALIASVPTFCHIDDRLRGIPGPSPTLGGKPNCCRFQPRCPFAKSECEQIAPALTEVESDHWVRCPYWEMT